MLSLSLEMLERRWPHAAPVHRAAIMATQVEAFALAEIDSALRLAHFMAQASEESRGGSRLVEDLNYSAERLMEVWPSRFPSIAAAAPYAHVPEKLANKVYNGRNGNALGSDDGWTFRGRGYLQATGRDGYTALSVTTGLDLVHQPDLICEPAHALICAGAVWKIHSAANAGADDDSIQRVTRAINGGLIGLPERRKWLDVWKRELGLP